MQTRRRTGLRLRETESQSGQSLVLIAVLMVGLLGFLGLVLDGGQVFASRRQSQNASDAAALAGARALAMRADNSGASEQQVWNAVLSLSQANGISAANVEAHFIDRNGADLCSINQNCGGVPSNPVATGVRVSTTLSFDPYFIKFVIGNQTIPVRAVAAAQSGLPTAAPGLMPMTLTCEPNNPDCFDSADSGGPEYQLFGDPQAGGNFQWVNYSSPCQTDTNDLVAYLRLTKRAGLVTADPTDSMMDPNSSAWVCGYTGVNAASGVTQALDWWLAKPVDQRHWIIPIFDVYNAKSGSNIKYHVILFADFVPTGYDFGGQANPSNFHCSSSGSGNGKGNGGNQNLKCIKGRFFSRVLSLQFAPGRCIVNGANICAIGLSQ